MTAAPKVPVEGPVVCACTTIRKSGPLAAGARSGRPRWGAQNTEMSLAGVNLSDPDIGLGGVCFASLVTETRSSTSTTATLKDFVLGGFGRCEASIATSQSWTPSDSATITVTGKTTWNGTVTFSLYPNLDCSGTTVLYTSDALAVSNADATVTTDDSTSGPSAVSASGNFSWKVFFDSATTGVADEESCVETTGLTIDNDTSSP